jgi:hypothetical protein
VVEFDRFRPELCCRSGPFTFQVSHDSTEIRWDRANLARCNTIERMTSCKFGPNCPGSCARYRTGCREQPCRDQVAAYQREHRVSHVPGNKAAKPPEAAASIEPTNVVQLKPAGEAPHVQPAAPHVMGESERAALERLDQLGVTDPAVTNRLRRLAEIMDDDDRRGQHLGAIKESDNIFKRLETGPKKKSGPKLAAIRAMSAPRNKRTGTTSE